jgi:tRNA-dihydrouridine synthase A
MSLTNEKIAIAPMLDWTDRHYRYFMRFITKHASLYSEMVVADAIIHGNKAKLLDFHPQEQPLIAQLGGSDPHKLAHAAQVCAEYGYSEINLNCGCPSERVQSGSFGACLMREPALVVDCLQAMQASVSIPVTIKQRIGLDYAYDYDYLAQFVAQVSQAGVSKFIIHARNAVLKGLSPKENREIPPLRYDFVYQLKRDFPHLIIMLNGGVKTHDEIKQHLTQIDSVMLGREAYHNPYLLATMDSGYYAQPDPGLSRSQVALAMLPYLQQHVQTGGRVHHVTRHMLGLYHGQSNARYWRTQLTALSRNNDLASYRHLCEEMHATDCAN